MTAQRGEVHWGHTQRLPSQDCFYHKNVEKRLAENKEEPKLLKEWRNWSIVKPSKG